MPWGNKFASMRFWHAAEHWPPLINCCSGSFSPQCHYCKHCHARAAIRVITANLRAWQPQFIFRSATRKTCIIGYQLYLRIEEYQARVWCMCCTGCTKINVWKTFTPPRPFLLGRKGKWRCVGVPPSPNHTRSARRTYSAKAKSHNTVACLSGKRLCIVFSFVWFSISDFCLFWYSDCRT